MISKLSIRNYALIKNLDIDPDKGLNIITGETGAGKSIMLGAVGLLLGNRADTKVLLDKEKKCIVECEFDVAALNLKEVFEELDLDYENSTSIRREIAASGKSRAFINDTPVTLDVLKQIGLRLIDIHSQNESIQLGDKQIKMKVIDDYSGSGALLTGYVTAFKDFQDTERKLQSLTEKLAQVKQDADYRGFLLDELVKADLKADEQELLEDELNRLDHAEEIINQLGQITGEFDAADFSINDRLKEASSVLRNLGAYAKNLESLAERFDSAAEEIKDVVADLAREQEQVELDPARVEEVRERLDLINRLQQKHRVNDIASLLEIQSKLEEDTLSDTNLSEEIERLKTELKAKEKVMIASAEVLSENRRKHIDQFSGAINELLVEVGMPDGRVEMTYKRVEPWTMGIDEVEILFSANKGIKPEPVSKVASGGEFSRLMFCVKYLLASKTAMPTVVFDEIDTGVSGEIAIKLAVMMKKMAQNHQIISISHLPQVAAKGDAHYYVYKDANGATTESLMRKLGEEDRLEEIAKMIGGDAPTDTARNSARELIMKE